jgi:hypothetical protein
MIVKRQSVVKASLLLAMLTVAGAQTPVTAPLVSDYPILFVVRRQYNGDHHNTATMFQTDEINTKSFEGGGALKTIDLAAGGKVKTLIELPEGITRDPEVYFDGSRIVFSMRKNIDDDYHIYEINADGSGLKQLTFGKGISDIDPLYLPDDTIVFSSTREPKFCMCAQHIMANLYRMDSDGAPMGVCRPQLRRRPGSMDHEPGRHEPRHLLGQQHAGSRRRYRCPHHPRHAAGALYLWLVSRQALGCTDDHRPQARA